MPIAGMLWVIGQIQPPPPVSVLRLVTVVGAAVFACAYGLSLVRGRAVATPVLGVFCLWLGLYPTAFTLGHSLAMSHERTFALAYCAAGLALAVAISRLPAERLESLTAALSIVGLVTGSLLLALLARTYIWPRALPSPISTAIATLTSATPAASLVREPPDIVHLVIDGMGRRDVLEREFGMELAADVASLQRLGFVVDQRVVHANYTQTQMTFASMFNMQYLDTLTSAAGSSNDRRPLMALVANAVVPRLLKQWGYDVHVLGSGYRSNGMFATSDRCDCPQLWFADAEFGALSLTPFRALVRGIGERAHFDRAVAVFDGARDFELGPHPTYLLAHVPMPHPPFLVDQTGAFVPTNQPASGRDGSSFAGSPEDYRRGYAWQAAFALRRAITAAEASLRRAEARGRRVVFIISGDHGPRLGFDVHRPSTTSAGMVLPVFLAIRMPGFSEDELPRSLVNVYRRVFRRVLGVPLADLPDRGFLSGFSNPYLGERIDFDLPTASSSRSVSAAGPAEGTRH